MGASTGGHDFGDKRHSDGKFATDAKSGEQSQDGEVPEISGECADTGEDGIHDNGDQHRANSPPAVSQNTEKQSACGPADEEE